MEDIHQPRKIRLTTFWEERRVIFLCFLIGLAQFQYGYDSAAVSGFQSMPGFLRIFGYPAVGLLQKIPPPHVLLLHPALIYYLHSILVATSFANSCTTARDHHRLQH
jgi:hypothetical protein